MNFKDLIDFIQQFMNLAECNLTDGKEFLRAVQGKRFCRQKGSGTRKSYLGKKQIGYGKATVPVECGRVMSSR